MPRAFKYVTATGEVVGVRESDSLPPLPTGMAYFDPGAAVIASPTSKYVSGGVMKDRQAVTIPAMTALVGESVAIAVPAGANWSVDDAFYIGPKSLSFATAGVRTIVFYGAWQGQTTVTVIALADLKASRKTDARAYRDAQVFAGCDTPLGRVQTDAASQDNILQSMIRAQWAVSTGDTSWSTVWRMEDDSLVPHDAAQMIAMALAVGARKTACFAASFAVADAITASDEPGSIDITAGYPASTGEVTR